MLDDSKKKIKRKDSHNQHLTAEKKKKKRQIMVRVKSEWVGEKRNLGPHNQRLWRSKKVQVNKNKESWNGFKYWSTVDHMLRATYKSQVFYGI